MSLDQLLQDRATRDFLLAARYSFNAPSTMLVVASDAGKGWPRRGPNVLVASGTRDDEALQDAHDALPTTGGLILVSDGTLNITAKLAFTKALWLVGQGGEKTILNAPSIADYAIAIREGLAADDDHMFGGIRNLTLQGNDTAGSTGIYVKGVTHFHIENCFTDNFRTGIVVTGSAHLSSIKGCQIKRSRTDGILLGTESNGVMLLNNWIICRGSYGLRCAGASSTKIMGNYFEQTAGQALTAFIRLEAGGGANSHKAAILGNEFDSSVTDAGPPDLRPVNAIQIAAAQSYTTILGNHFSLDAPSGPMVNDAGTETDTRFNYNYKTENSGASTGTGGQQTVAHGLAFTPTRQQIALIAGSATANPYHSADPDATNIYVTAALNQAWYWARVG